MASVSASTLTTSSSPASPPNADSKLDSPQGDINNALAIITHFYDLKNPSSRVEESARRIHILFDRIKKEESVNETRSRQTLRVLQEHHQHLHNACKGAMSLNSDKRLQDAWVALDSTMKWMEDIADPHNMDSVDKVKLVRALLNENSCCHILLIYAGPDMYQEQLKDASRIIDELRNHNVVSDQMVSLEAMGQLLRAIYDYQRPKTHLDISTPAPRQLTAEEWFWLSMAILVHIFRSSAVEFESCYKATSIPHHNTATYFEVLAWESMDKTRQSDKTTCIHIVACIMFAVALFGCVLSGRLAWSTLTSISQSGTVDGPKDWERALIIGIAIVLCVIAFFQVLATCKRVSLLNENFRCLQQNLYREYDSVRERILTPVILARHLLLEAAGDGDPKQYLTNNVREPDVDSEEGSQEMESLLDNHYERKER